MAKAGGPDHLLGVDLGGDGLIHRQLSQHGDELLRGDAAGAQEPCGLLGQVHDGALHAHPAVTAVHHRIDPALVIVEDVLGGDGGGLAGGIGRGSRHGDTGQPDDLPGGLVVGAADAHGGEAAGGAPGHDVLGGQDHGQGTGPEFFSQQVGAGGDIVGEILHLNGIRHMEDQGVVLGTALGDEDLGNGVFIQTVGTQTVDRLRGDGHQASLTQNFCRHVAGLHIRRRQIKGFHIYNYLFL